MNECHNLHAWARSLTRHTFPFNAKDIPLNGIYVLFEKGELGHDRERIVRIGTHTGNGQLRSRLKQHFVNENKDRSIFRKNIGRCILNKAGDAYLDVWNIDYTTKANRLAHGHRRNLQKESGIESQISAYLQANMTFAVVDVPEKAARLQFEAKMISTVAQCKACCPSKTWRGRHSPVKKIRESGLWQVQGLGGNVLSAAELNVLMGR